MRYKWSNVLCHENYGTENFNTETRFSNEDTFGVFEESKSSITVRLAWAGVWAISASWIILWSIVINNRRFVRHSDWKYNSFLFYRSKYVEKQKICVWCTPLFIWIRNEIDSEWIWFDFFLKFHWNIKIWQIIYIIPQRCHLYYAIISTNETFIHNNKNFLKKTLIEAV